MVPPDPPRSEPVVITGLGVVSTLGFSLEELARRVSAGEQAPQSPAESEMGAQIPAFPLDVVPQEKRTRIGRLDRLCQAFLAASYLAVEDASLRITPDNTLRTGLSFGTGLGCLLTNAEYFQKVVAQGPAAASPRLFAYTVSSAAAGEVSIALGIHGPNVTSHMGLAAGLGAVGYAFDLIQMGKADVVLAGGADVTGAALVDGLRDMALLKTRHQSRPFRDRVAGMWPSEGAVVVVLESLEHAQRRGVRRLARVAGHAAGFEPTLTRPAPLTTGIVTTLRRSLAASGCGAGEVDTIYASAHGTPIDAVEFTALSEVFTQEASPLLLAPKAALGETFGANVLLALALAIDGTRQARPIAPGMGFRLTAPGAVETADSTSVSRVSVLHALCYSGNVASLVLTGEP